MSTQPTHRPRFMLYLVGHAHIDLGYRWRWNETVHRIARDTFAGVLRMMESVPDFTFVQSQLALYEAMKVHYPEILGQIRQRIAEGRWIVADGWCEYDHTMPGGESRCATVSSGGPSQRTASSSSNIRATSGPISSRLPPPRA